MTPWHSTLLRLLKITFLITRASTRLKRASLIPLVSYLRRALSVPGCASPTQRVNGGEQQPILQGHL